MNIFDIKVNGKPVMESLYMCEHKGSNDVRYYSFDCDDDISCFSVVEFNGKEMSIIDFRNYCKRNKSRISNIVACKDSETGTDFILHIPSWIDLEFRKIIKIEALDQEMSGYGFIEMRDICEYCYWDCWAGVRSLYKLFTAKTTTLLFKYRYKKKMFRVTIIDKPAWLKLLAKIQFAKGDDFIYY